MNRQVILSTFAALCLLWGGERVATAGRLQVLTVLTDHAWLAQQIGGDHVQVRSMMTGREDPHHIVARPSLILLASNADLFVSPGMGLDIGYTPLLLRNSRNPKIQRGAKGYVDASIYVNKLEVPTQVSRAMGDLHAAGNPHYHLDPIAMLAAGRAILEGMIRIDPLHKQLYKKRFQTLEKNLLQRLVGKVLVQAAGVPKLKHLLTSYQLIRFLKKTKIGGQPLLRYLGGWMRQMLPLRGQKLVTYHRQWIYFTKRFGLQSIGELEPKPGIPPSAHHLQQIISLCRKEKPRWIIAANFYGAGSARFVAKKVGVPMLHLAFHTKGAKGLDNYPTFYSHLIKRLRTNK